MRVPGLQNLLAILRHRAFVALLDQAAVSLASFGTGILLSRAFTGARREELGLYYLAVTIGIFIVEFQNALVSTPLTVVAPQLDPEARRRFQGSSMIHHAALSAAITLLLGIAGLFFASPSHQPMLLACSITAFALGLRNFARFLNFSLHRPHIACAADWLVTILQMTGILLLVRFHRLTAASAVDVIGGASLVGGLLALLMSRQFVHVEFSKAWNDFRDNWRLSRWVFASGVIGNVGCSLYPWLLDTFSNTLQAAVWGNCNTVSSAGNPVLMGLQNWMAPAVAHAYTERTRRQFRNYVTRLGALYLLILPPMLLVLALLTKPLLEKLYHDFTPNTLWLVILLGAGSLVQSTGFIYSRGLFSLGRGATDVGTNVIPVVVLIAVGIPLSIYYGAIGGSISLLIAQIAATTVRAVLFWNACAGARDQSDDLPSGGPQRPLPIRSERKPAKPALSAARVEAL